jgi:hypothetical protein
MIDFNKSKVREALSTENLFELVETWGGNPQYTSFGFIADTICHNPPGEGSRKLYFYTNTTLFRCYTGCAEPIFDIFELYIKVIKIQKGKDIDLNDAVRSLAQKFGIAGERREDDPTDELEDWKVFANYERIQDIELKTNEIVLKEYDPIILTRFNYDVAITPWLEEDITQEVIRHNRIGFYPGGDQITIPHFDEHGRFIGLRGRTLSKEEGELYGKYRPLKINQQLYNHPLGMNLYNLNNSKNNIPILKKAIIFEGEKSCLLYASYFGIDNDISVACCGSSVSLYQIEMLQRAGAQEIIIAFDRQFQSIGDDEFKKLKANLLKIHSKYKNDVIISFIFDKEMITNYKSSPIDHGPDIFLQLFKERIVL